MRTIGICFITAAMGVALVYGLCKLGQTLRTKRDIAREHHCDIWRKYRRTPTDSMRYELVCEGNWRIAQ